MTNPNHGKESELEMVAHDLANNIVSAHFGWVENPDFFVPRIKDRILPALTTATAPLVAEVERLEADCVVMRSNIMLWSARFQKYQSWIANGIPPKACIKAMMEDYEELSRLSEPAIACKSGQPILDHLTTAQASIAEKDARIAELEKALKEVSTAKR